MLMPRNRYTDLGSTLNTTAAQGIPAILSAPYYLDQVSVVLALVLAYQTLQQVSITAPLKHFGTARIDPIISHWSWWCD
jgi:hypothetical protein